MHVGDDGAAAPAPRGTRRRAPRVSRSRPRSVDARRCGGAGAGPARDAAASRRRTSLPDGRAAGSRAQEIDAQRVEVLRDASGRGRGGERASRDCLSISTCSGAPVNGSARSAPRRASTPTQYQSLAGGRPRRRRLLGRHVRDGAEHRACVLCVHAGLSQRRDQPEVEERRRGPSCVTRTLDGLMSRWSFPASCSAQSASASWPSAARSRVAVRALAGAAADPLREGDALHELHREEPALAVGDELVQRRRRSGARGRRASGTPA